MITKAYETAMMAHWMRTPCSIKDTEGNLRTFTPFRGGSCPDDFATYASNMQTSFSARGVIFLSGGRSPSRDDYTSDGTIVSNLSINSSDNSYEDENGYVLSKTYVITNNNSNAVTIDEVCWTSAVWYTSSKAHTFLADRTKLESPVTIEAGGFAQITYTIRLNYPVT